MPTVTPNYDREHFINLWTLAVKEVRQASAALAADLKEGYRPDKLLELMAPTTKAFRRVEDYLKDQ